jgi:hypothetical protein
MSSNPTSIRNAAISIFYNKFSHNNTTLHPEQPAFPQPLDTFPPSWTIWHHYSREGYSNEAIVGRETRNETTEPKTTLVGTPKARNAHHFPPGRYTSHDLLRTRLHHGRCSHQHTRSVLEFGQPHDILLAATENLRPQVCTGKFPTVQGSGRLFCLFSHPTTFEPPRC